MGARSHVRKRRQGCLSGCLTRLLLTLGLCALLFVGACVLGLVRIDPATGAPALSLGSFTQSLADIEYDVVRLVLEEEHNNQSRAAKRLKMGRSTLWSLLKKREQA